MAKKSKGKLTKQQEQMIKENNELLKLTEEELIAKINTKANQINRRIKTYEGMSDTHANIYRKNVKNSLKHLNLSERDLMTKTGNLSRSKKLYEKKTKQALINQYRQYEKLLTEPQYKNKKSFDDYVQKQRENMSRSSKLSHAQRINSFMDTVKRHALVQVMKDYKDLSRMEQQKLANEIVDDMVKAYGDEEEYYDSYINWINENKETKYFDSNQQMDTQIEKEVNERYLAYAKQSYADRLRMARNPIPNKPRYGKSNKGKVQKTKKR